MKRTVEDPWKLRLDWTGKVTASSFQVTLQQECMYDHSFNGPEIPCKTHTYAHALYTCTGTLYHGKGRRKK